MGDLEYSLKEVISKLDGTVQSLSTAVSDLRVVMANDYQKKTDCDTCRADLNGKINNVIAWLFGCYGLILTACGVIIAFK
jgi:hypothetical protein